MFTSVRNFKTPIDKTGLFILRNSVRKISRQVIEKLSLIRKPLSSLQPSFTTKSIWNEGMKTHFCCLVIFVDDCYEVYSVIEMMKSHPFSSFEHRCWRTFCMQHEDAATYRYTFSKLWARSHCKRLGPEQVSSRCRRMAFWMERQNSLVERV